MASSITRADKITQQNQPSQYQAQQKKYSDFTANFDFHPDTGDLFRITDINAVKSSLRNLLQTNFYERPFQPRLGSNIPALLFENMSAATLASLSDTITQTINKYEPRVNIISLNCLANTDAESVSINLTFSINSIPDNQTISVVIDRVR
jgi:phage baseplate assembly protein W